MSDEQLRAYIGRILELKASSQGELTGEELGAIAQELGLTEADLAAGREAAEAHLERGLGYCRHDRWADAVGELEQAVALLPGRLDALEALAQAHAGRWRQQRQNADRDAAIRLARRCLALESAHAPAFQLLNELDPPAARTRPRRIAAVLGAAALIAVTGILLLRQQPGQRPPAAPQARVDTGEIDIPVTLAAPKAAGLTLIPRHSRLKRYPDSAFYQLGALLQNDGQTELSKIQLKAELLGPQNQVLAAEQVEALATHMAPVRPGDKHPVSHLFRAQREVTAVRLTVTLRDEVPVRKLQSVPRPIALGWSIAQPGGLQLTARERSAPISRMTILKPEHLYFKPVFELRNDGDVSIRRLKLELSMFDANNTLLKASAKTAVYGEGLALPPGESRALSFIEKLPTSYHHYRLAVLEVE